MPKKQNPKKMAARAYGNEKALRALEGGEYLVGKVIKALGNCSFRAEIDLGAGKGVRELTVLVRGKFKGGVNCSTRVEPGVFVAVDGVLSDVPSRQPILEIVGVINRQKTLERARGAGRVSDRLVASGADERTGDDLFDRSGEEATGAGDIWAKRDTEREEQAEDILARYRTKASGAKARAAVDLLRGTVHERTDLPEDDEKVDEFDLEDFAALAGGGAAAEAAPKPASGLNRAERRALAAAAASVDEEELARQQAELAALYRKAPAEDEEVTEAQLAKARAEFQSRKVATSWDEEEIDIDAI